MPEMTPEQQEELKKKLESMSPEELREFQKQNCIFCHIVSGKVQAKKIFEDEKSLAILDINPANPGHVLLIPKEHYMIMPQMPEDVLNHQFIVAKKISNCLLKAMEVKGTNIIVANGAAAGQRAQHFIIHIIPRKEEDGLEFTLPSNTHSEQKLESIAEAVAKRLMQKRQPKSAQQILSEKKVVDAQFTQQKKEEALAAPKEAPKQEPEKKKEIAKKPGSLDLDSIARVLNG